MATPKDLLTAAIAHRIVRLTDGEMARLIGYRIGSDRATITQYGIYQRIPVHEIQEILNDPPTLVHPLSKT